ncbi:Hypothetical protein NTJ_10987 [Nesidiocoris tenuis]|uniref:WH2 domain-containing protein n=1 Tax=Nesidiocoris tenuis TaxID=355587 RepID=A0ABN7B170_9HEMI|nr:Hypothetical protein NTJ_10987 [Nesidiocoris tenuis]
MPPPQRKSRFGSPVSSVSTASISPGLGRESRKLQSLAANNRRVSRPTAPLEKVVVRFLDGPTEQKWPPAMDQATARKWRSINGSFDILDRLMVRSEKSSLAMGRQLSLDTSQRPNLRRQISEELRPPPPGPLKIAWTSTDQTDPPSVEVVAKKCGQPKPAMVKPPKSPFLADENAAVLYSRQQLTERLRTSWKKTSGRHNLNIFLNQSFESEADNVSEVIDSPATRSPSTTDDDEPDDDDRPAEAALKDKASASDRRLAFRAMGRQSKISAMDSPCPTPEPFNKEQGQVRRMMSAPSRPQVKKLTKSATVESRVKSAPSKRKHKPQTQRRRGKGDSSDEEKAGATRRVKRGVDKGEIVTMVSLVSPAESEDEEPPAAVLPPATPKPPTPNPTSESPKPNPPPPPPILTLRKPAKTVTFRPVVAPPQSSTQFQTSFPLKRTLVHQNTIGSISPSNNLKTPNLTRPQLQRQSTLPLALLTTPSTTPEPIVVSVRPPSALKQPPKVADYNNEGPLETIASVDETSGDLSEPSSNGQSNGRPPPKVQRKTLSFAGRPPQNPVPSTARRKFIQATHSVIKIEPEPIKEAELPPPLPVELPHRQVSEDISSDQGEQDSPVEQVFKNSKEKECYQLFKKMSDRGVSVSFETVLRGLLTPTEYRMRRSALLSVC